MASTLSRKRKSPEPNTQANEDAESQTPLGSPTEKKMKVTQNQKQALIDNLQLEITERARKLRAHYALQAQDLRARIERRINRIPVSLRKQTMGDLLARHVETTKGAEANPDTKKPTLRSKAPKPMKLNTQVTSASTNSVASKLKGGFKRKSNDASDKENAGFRETTASPLSNPKKRNKNNTGIGAPRTVSQFAESGVLSPKSSNSRTFPQSPLRISPAKSQQQQQQQPLINRVVSPLKPFSPIKAATTTTSARNTKPKSVRGMARNISSHGNSSDTTTVNIAPKTKKATIKSTTAPTTRKAPSRPVTRQQHSRRDSTSTVDSSASAGTTIVRPTRTHTGSKKSSSTTKRPTVPRGQAATASTARKMTAAASKKAQAEQNAPTRRVLRNRA